MFKTYNTPILAKTKISFIPLTNSLLLQIPALFTKSILASYPFLKSIKSINGSITPGEKFF